MLRFSSRVWGRVSPNVRCDRGLALSTSEAERDAYSKIRSGVAPATGKSLAKIAADVWGHVPEADRAPPGHRSARKLLGRPLRGPLYASWYPRRPETYASNEFKLTEKQERRQKKLRQLRASGKGPPKKGAGKRSSK